MQKKEKSNLQHNAQSIFFLIIATILGLLIYYGRDQGIIFISEKRFEKMMLEQDVKSITLITNQHLVEVTIKDDALKKESYQKELAGRPAWKKSHRFIYAFRIPSFEIFDKNFKELEAKLSPEDRIGYMSEERSEPGSFINWSFLLTLFLIYWFFIRKSGSGIAGPGGQFFSMNTLKTTIFDKDNKIKVTFQDVAGMKEAKEELKEMVDFLKTPEKFTSLGGKIPKGVLLIGPPGTGKTLLAKAVAGEANVPFICLSGSDFVEMFVGIGAARVRDLFKKAKEKAPCIVFIDEIDAVGRARGKANMPGVNDERENTLNSLLVEMDGFSTNSGVVIIAATNRPEVLDSALLRPGRFDRQVSIDNPDIIDREAIIKYHSKQLKLEKHIRIKQLAEQTPGFSGADLANMCNEAALIAARKNKRFVTMVDFQAAIDRIIGGLEKRNKVISPAEKRIVAYHEAGHAIAGWFLEHAHPLIKVSIVPRGTAALGYAQYLPKEQFIYQEEELLDEMAMALGGRAAEELIFGKISTGALSDLERTTKLAYSMVTIYGMNPKVGHLSFYNSKQTDYAFTKPYSEKTAYAIDEEVRNIIDAAYERVKALLKDNMDKLMLLAEALLARETLFKSDLERLIGKRFVSISDTKNAAPTANSAAATEQEIEDPNQDMTPSSIKNDPKDDPDKNITDVQGFVRNDVTEI
ncbi:ATP-dependent zinc metalloprotease FtsH [Cardinium endosymbiont of Culicoides punctatus]|uniref:ATP-dependent zinc metalloprotease FtsH n=1 Tax=Cardinium endosymbiont of Culicoides punctatus TaxID=2304601 RepID=UPI0010E56F47|nr:ATP-dependent zinc metalloprotease FtsH [Cardinium endosymbiont of Culicoides punctatus]TDG94957.1 ATP-dependent zinc metalloprotease FtsH [Cardinium endosymbiont of Culicoides punctatus]